MNLFVKAAAAAAEHITLRDKGISSFEFQVCKVASERAAEWTGRSAALVGDIAMVKAGGANSAYRHLLNQLWKEPVWHERFDQLVEPVKVAAAKLAVAGAAASVPSVLSNALGGVREGSMGLLGTLLLLSSAGGASLGALNWHLRRGAEEGDAENEATRAQIDELRNSRSELAM